MCFVLYIAAPQPLPIVAWDPVTCDIHTEPLSDVDRGVESHFQNKYIYFVGSDTHCGCGFRNASFQNGSWPEEEWRPEGDTRHIEAQPNHEHLVRFVREHLSGVEAIELYGAWEGDFSAPALSRQTIPLDRITDLDFYFRDQGYYKVVLGDERR